MKLKTLFPCLILGCTLAAATSCIDFTYSSTGRAWVVRADEMIHSDAIRARRAVTFHASGRLEAGTVTAQILRNGSSVGQPVILHAGSVDMKAEYAFESGLWSFRAQADEAARGDLYLSIADR